MLCPAIASTEQGLGAPQDSDMALLCPSPAVHPAESRSWQWAGASRELLSPPRNPLGNGAALFSLAGQLGTASSQFGPRDIPKREVSLCLLDEEKRSCRRSRLGKIFRILQSLHLLFPNEDSLMVSHRKERPG